MLQLVAVWPFPAEKVAEFLKRARRSVVVEGNATGQLDGLIRQYCLREPGHRLNRTDGRPFSPELVYDTIHRILGTPGNPTAANHAGSSEGGR
jgi:2-oxoglutarate/2-oxoacid ferredoxin oxidoreductase subunit alpha